MVESRAPLDTSSAPPSRLTAQTTFPRTRLGLTEDDLVACALVLGREPEQAGR